MKICHGIIPSVLWLNASRCVTPGRVGLTLGIANTAHTTLYWKLHHRLLGWMDDNYMYVVCIGGNVHYLTNSKSEPCRLKSFMALSKITLKHACKEVPLPS